MPITHTREATKVGTQSPRSRGVAPWTFLYNSASPFKGALRLTTVVHGVPCVIVAAVEWTRSGQASRMADFSTLQRISREQRGDGPRNKCVLHKTCWGGDVAC